MTEKSVFMSNYKDLHKIFSKLLRYITCNLWTFSMNVIKVTFQPTSKRNSPTWLLQHKITAQISFFTTTFTVPLADYNHCSLLHELSSDLIIKFEPKIILDPNQASLNCIFVFCILCSIMWPCQGAKLRSTVHVYTQLYTLPNVYNRKTNDSIPVTF